MFGAWQKIVKVDLSSKAVQIEKLDEEIYQNYSSGSGLAVHLLYQNGTYRAEPLRPENNLMFIPGLLTGIPIYCASRTSICAKSPLTGIWGETNFGGFWGKELRLAGYDALWVTGQSKSPVYLWVTQDNIEIRDAREIWGKNTFESERLIRERTHEKARVVCIGRGGEKLVRFASVISEGLKSRAGGRTGMGAVMGSKNLKGIAVVGNRNPIPVHDPVSLAKALNEYIPILKKHTALHTLYGTGRLVMPKEATGGLPLRNFSLAYPWSEGAQKISGQTIAKTIRQKDYACYYCPIKCGKEVMISSGPYARMVSRGPEYETLAGFGSNLLNDNLENIVTANYLCNEYGLDTISTSVSLAFAFDCFERGLISKRDCDGLELKWGNPEAILEMVRKIGEREGLGDILAEGSRMAAQKIGGSSGEIIAHAKGLEPSTTMPTPTVSLALSWATSNRGACHLEGFSHIVEGGVPVSDLGFESMDGYTSYGKGRLVKIMQNLMAVYNNLGICKMLFSGRLGPERMSQWVHHVTGWDLDKEKLMELGDRTYNWKRAFNIQCGVSRTDDQISPKLLGGLRKEGSLEEKRIFFEGMLKDYYQERGWDEKGIPSSEILQKYGIGL